MSREFINAASNNDVEVLKEELMKYSKKSQEAFVLAWISLTINLMLIIYLILTQ